jgi:hypothetical protein
LAGNEHVQFLAKVKLSLEDSPHPCDIYVSVSARSVSFYGVMLGRRPDTIIAHTDAYGQLYLLLGSCAPSRSACASWVYLQPLCGVKWNSSVWLRLTCLFGLPDDEDPDNLMAAALGPILRAALEDIVETPLPSQISALLDEIKRRQGSRHLEAVAQRVGKQRLDFAGGSTRRRKWRAPDSSPLPSSPASRQSGRTIAADPRSSTRAAGRSSGGHMARRTCPVCSAPRSRSQKASSRKAPIISRTRAGILRAQADFPTPCSNDLRVDHEEPTRSPARAITQDRTSREIRGRLE